MSVVCDKGKGRPLGELKATFSTALKVLQCSKTIMSYDQSQCVLLALCVCALGWGLTEKVLGLGQRRGGGGPPLQPPKLLNTPRGHTLAGGGPRGFYELGLRVTSWPSCWAAEALSLENLYSRI